MIQLSLQVTKGEAVVFCKIIQEALRIGVVVPEGKAVELIVAMQEKLPLLVQSVVNSLGIHTIVWSVHPIP